MKISSLSRSIRWVLLIPFSIIFIPLFLWILVTIPMFIFQLVHTWNIFLYFMVGGIFLGFYYTGMGVSIMLYQQIISKYRPDYWVTALVLFLASSIFIYYYFIQISQIIDTFKDDFLRINGIIFLIAIVPAYLSIAFYFLIFPFIKKSLID